MRTAVYTSEGWWGALREPQGVWGEAHRREAVAAAGQMVREEHAGALRAAQGESATATAALVAAMRARPRRAVGREPAERALRRAQLEHVVAGKKVAYVIEAVERRVVTAEAAATRPDIVLDTLLWEATAPAVGWLALEPIPDGGYTLSWDLGEDTPEIQAAWAARGIDD